MSEIRTKASKMAKLNRLKMRAKKVPPGYPKPIFAEGVAEIGEVDAWWTPDFGYKGTGGERRHKTQEAANGYLWKHFDRIAKQERRRIVDEVIPNLIFQIQRESDRVYGKATGSTRLEEDARLEAQSKALQRLAILLREAE